MQWPLQHCSYEGVNGFVPAVGPGRDPFAKVCTRGPQREAGRPPGARRLGPRIGSAARGLRDRHRCGDERCPGPRRRRVGGRDRRLVPRARPSTTPARDGSSTTPSRSGTPSWPRSPRWPSAATSAGSTGRRHRHHQPARDGGRLGPRHAGVPCTGPSCGRTGAPPSVATSCAPRAISRWCASAPASSSTPTSRARRWSGCSARAASRSATTSCSATVDAWLIWNLTGGTDGGVLATDATNASRTLLYDIRELSWSDELCEHLRRAHAARSPRCDPRAGGSAWCGARSATAAPAVAGVPVSGVAGDQQAALFGQACVSPGMAKVTYGTGSFVLMNVGEECPPPSEGLLTTVAWDLGEHGGSSPVAYALEGAVFVTGAAIQWLRDGLGLIDEAAGIGPLAEQVDDSEGVFVVPAFTGLGSPWWDPYARGTITGLTRGRGRGPHRPGRDRGHGLPGARRGGRHEGRRAPSWPRCGSTGGRPSSTCCCRSRPTNSGCRCRDPPRPRPRRWGRPRWREWPRGCGPSVEELESIWSLEAAVRGPGLAVTAADRAYGGWRHAVERSLGWAVPGS